jgi:poly(A) polymerase
MPLVQFAREGEKTLLKPMQWNRKSRKWIEAADYSTNNPKKKLSVMTWNTLCDTGALELRAPHLYSFMKERNPDIIFLQEVSPTFMRKIVEEKWVRSDYQVSDITGISCLPYGTMLLTKIPMSNVILNVIETKQAKFVLIAEMIVNNERVNFSTVQLEDNDPEIRKNQLTKIFGLLDKNPVTFFAGDFQFDPKNEAEQKNVNPNYKDVWDVLKPGEVQPTWGIMYPDPKNTPGRHDRILWKSNRWVPKDIQVFGNLRVGEHKGKEVWTSKHLGVFANFEYQEAK